MTSTRRYDPDRRDRIIEAALDIMAEHGLANTTHRRVAELADVSLGSMTYHFNGMDELIAQAFSRLAATTTDQFTCRMAQARDKDEARDAVVELICGDVWANPRNMRLVYELYANAARRPALQDIWQSWTRDSAKALELHFAPDVARALNVVIEGGTIHNSIQPGLLSRAEIARMVALLTA